MTEANGAPERPRPLQAAAFLVGGTGAVVLGLVADLMDLLVSVGLPEAVADPLGRVVLGLIGLAIAFGLVRLAEPKVTPTTNPQDDRGVSLVPADAVRATADAPASVVAAIEQSAAPNGSVRPPDLR